MVQIGRESEGWSLAKANDFRISLIANVEKPAFPSDQTILKLANQKKEAKISALVDLYFKQKAAENGAPPKTETESRQRFKKHFHLHWSKTPAGITELNLLHICQEILQSDDKMATVSRLLGFYRTLFRFAVKANLSPALDFEIPVPKASELKNQVTERLI